jgi:hypothetical protein
MKYKFFTIILISLFSFQSFAQISKPQKRKFNVGISTALGGLNFSFFPSVDLNYKNTMLKISPGFMAFSAGISQEIMPLSVAFYNVRWIVSAYYSYGSYKGIYAKKFVSKLNSLPDNVSRGILLTGVRVYFGKRWYSTSQFGIAYSSFREYSTDITYPINSTSSITLKQTIPASQSVIPFVEFGIGFNIFKTFPTTDDISF